MERRAAQSHKPAQMCDLECVWPQPGTQHCDSNLRHRTADQYQFNFMTLTSRISKIKSWSYEKEFRRIVAIMIYNIANMRP